MPRVSATLSSATLESHGKYYTCSGGNSDQTVAVHTFNNGGEELCNYGVLYDKSKHCALWVAYAMGGDHYGTTVSGRSDAYAYDPAISNSAQPNILSGSYGDYSRGHLMAASFRKVNDNAYDQAFYVTNIAPQSTSYNSSSSAWNEVETAELSKASSLANSTTKKLYVVAGTVFGNGYTTTTCKNDSMPVAVPTAFYKCYMLLTFNSSGVVSAAQGGAYLIPHNDYSKSIGSYSTSIDAVESITGFDFFANVPDSLENAAESTTTSFFNN